MCIVNSYIPGQWLLKYSKKKTIVQPNEACSGCTGRVLQEVSMAVSTGDCDSRFGTFGQLFSQERCSEWDVSR